ncbi:hypothetical protein DFH06DRAFT_1124326 [Mycena polygramma]|nr:hypothetical protein DFH06DRAFT_1124326 [Mycena polygramma]
MGEEAISRDQRGPGVDLNERRSVYGDTMRSERGNLKGREARAEERKNYIVHQGVPEFSGIFLGCSCSVWEPFAMLTLDSLDLSKLAQLKRLQRQMKLINNPAEEHDFGTAQQMRHSVHVFNADHVAEDRDFCTAAEARDADAQCMRQRARHTRRLAASGQPQCAGYARCAGGLEYYADDGYRRCAWTACWVVRHVRGAQYLRRRAWQGGEDRRARRMGGLRAIDVAALVGARHGGGLLPREGPGELDEKE